ncbi:MAG: hypothetical protein PVI55_20200, partial [Desulfobacterales bacterium]
IRHFNDIDHFTPIIWRMWRDDNPVAVYCMNPDYDIGGDYRLQFLKGLGIKVDVLYEEFTRRLGLLHGVLRFISQAGFAIARKLDASATQYSWAAKLQQRFHKIGVRYYKRNRKRYYNSAWARRILEQTQAQVLCFDWVAPWRFVVDAFMRSAKEMSIPVLSLPHGVFIYTNDNVKIGSIDQERNFKKFNPYDAIAVQNELFKKIIAKSGIAGDKIFVLGSARYCDEWMAQNKKILPRQKFQKADTQSKLKVVFMTTRPNYKIHVDRMLKTFEVLSNLDDIEVTIKPHTRSGDEAKIYEDLPLSNVSNISSVELCEWADVMLVIGSSILIETLLQGKPVIYLKYLHENKTVYEEIGACWTVQNDNELKKALVALQTHKNRVPYSQAQVDRFLSDIVYGGLPKRDVLGDYEQFIVNSTRKVM